MVHEGHDVICVIATKRKIITTYYQVMILVPSFDYFFFNNMEQNKNETMVAMVSQLSDNEMVAMATMIHPLPSCLLIYKLKKHNSSPPFF